jgi:Ca2+-binding RTX toxin-like protein
MSAPNPRPVETLEGRRLLSAATFVANGVLHVNGDFFAGNTITVDDNAGVIDVSIQWTTAKGVAKQVTGQFDTSTTSISSVFVRGGFKADNIQVGQHSSTAFALPTRVDGIAGHDVITTGAGSDTINGGLGGDTITSGDGNDIVRGGSHADLITVGNGDDKVRGGFGFGADTIVAGNGNDTIVGGFGNDSITVGDGTDIVHGNAGNDTIHAGNGNDSLWGGLGNDDIVAGNGTDTFGGVLGQNTLMGGTGPDTFVVRKNFPAGQTTSYNPAKDHLDEVHHEAAAPTV